METPIFPGRPEDATVVNAARGRQGVNSVAGAGGSCGVFNSGARDKKWNIRCVVGDMESREE
eukprot:8291712-Pyramimonas_sp.AAC.1